MNQNSNPVNIQDFLVQDQYNKGAQLKKGRSMRPSQFLNDLNFLPQIIDKTASSRKSSPKKSNLGSKFLSPQSSQSKLPLIDEAPIMKRNKYHHKSHASMPQFLEARLLMPQHSVITELTNYDEESPKSKPKIIENKSAVQISSLQIPKAEKHVQFRKSIMLVDLDLGVISKGLVDGSRKPLKRIVRKNTMIKKVDE